MPHKVDLLYGFKVWQSVRESIHLLSDGLYSFQVPDLIESTAMLFFHMFLPVDSFSHTYLLSLAYLLHSDLANDLLIQFACPVMCAANRGHISFIDALQVSWLVILAEVPTHMREGIVEIAAKDPILIHGRATIAVHKYDRVIVVPESGVVESPI